MFKFFLTVLILVSYCRAGDVPIIAPRVNLKNKHTKNQTDLCIWEHATGKHLSTLIVSDSKSQKIFVYDLQGRLLQTINAVLPGDIDIRYNVPFNNRKIDIIGFNQRKKSASIVLFEVDRDTRKLKRIDNKRLRTKESTASCLYQNRQGKLYSFIATDTGKIHQYELSSKGDVFVHKLIRTVNINENDLETSIKSCAADDVYGVIYLSTKYGIYAFSAEPAVKSKPQIILKKFQYQ
ncbi:MAG: phytase, partial [Lentisphaeria bacterium]|nr:phytase [Lentisphaeria bacterium]NQZ67213.1 phytase [Lentisphaeria bacterium]